MKMKKILSVCLLIIILTNTVVYGDININDNIKGALLGDLETGEIIYEYNINEQLAIASMSKLMTYLVLMDAVSDGKVSLDDDIVVSGHAASTDGSKFGLVSGETIKLSLLVKGLLIVSGNDCATAIAEHVGNTVDNFVKMMNEKSSELGLLSGSFINPHGLPVNDEKTGQNHMSAADLYKLTRHILTEYPEVLEITKQGELVVTERNYRKQATNPILGVVEGADGLKTGFTDKAGLCLVSTLPVNGEQGFRLIGIIMGASTYEDRVNKTKELLEYGRDNFRYDKIIKQSEVADNVYITNSKDGRIEVFPSSDYNKILKNNDVVKTKISYNDTVKAPLKSGDKIGTISIYVNDKEVGQVDAVVNKDIQVANILIRIIRFFENIFN
ncbi:D-alanyl-D-alanine carboxypeptidase family protein [Sedimentibacter sp.]|uniref:D-alanyl-D-alanine carboxypeptidase family protein n=1 Tax=Sedimentibacter sp. TaxID=1960295 RepID=UPI00289FB56B|nr:D-alanyl-D-alanine carboxypeptidase family protein [Sedimentibacter sp.]